MLLVYQKIVELWTDSAIFQVNQISAPNMSANGTDNATNFMNRRFVQKKHQTHAEHGRKQKFRL